MTTDKKTYSTMLPFYSVGFDELLVCALWDEDAIADNNDGNQFSLSTKSSDGLDVQRGEIGYLLRGEMFFLVHLIKFSKGIPVFLKI